MAIANLEGKTKIVATKLLQSPQGEPPFYRVAEVHFPNMEHSIDARRPPAARRRWLTQ
jgi:hypothetical protein